MFFIMPIIFLFLNLYVFLRLRFYVKSVFNSRKINILYYILYLIIILLIIYSGVKGYVFGLAFSLYMAVFLYGFIVVLIVDILRIFIKKVSDKKWFGIISLSVFLIVFYGFINSYIIDIKEYNIENTKNINPLKILQISDTHYGATQGIHKAKEMVNKINNENADIVLFTGDIFDGDYSWVKNPDEIANTLSTINSKYGTYACFGNHDNYGGLTKEMYEFLEKANINLLEDDYKLINNEFYVIGRVDSKSFEYPNVKSIGEITKDIDKSKFIISLDHRPKELLESEKAGVDLVLSGHTHKGQTFPFNIVIKYFWDNSYGLKEYGNMTSIVTSGVGIWGPPIRVGTDSEIVVININ
ncbi:MAG: metallophosphoesterase [Lachnospirales bacterium]